MNTAVHDLRTLDDVDIDGGRVLLRADLDVPLMPAPAGTGARVADDSRIHAALPTIEELRRRGASLVLASNLGHPRGHNPAYSMQPVAERLSELTGIPVPLAPAVTGPDVVEVTRQLVPGEVLMLENVGFEAADTRNDPTFASALAELGDLYVDDAFANAHDALASTVGVARRLPCAAGRLMEREILALSAIIERPSRPFVAVLGGTKVSEKSGGILHLLELADKVCIGGALCFPFLAALGHSTGRSLCPHDELEPARLALAAAAGFDRLELPRDFVLGSGGGHAGATTVTLNARDVPDDWVALDIGPDTAAHYATEINGAGAVFWNGPMGRLELPAYAAGTRSMATAMASSAAITVAAGGDTVRALRSYGLEDRVSHISTGDEAALALIAGGDLPGVNVLLRAPVAQAVGSCSAFRDDTSEPITRTT